MSLEETVGPLLCSGKGERLPRDYKTILVRPCNAIHTVIRHTDYGKSGRRHHPGHFKLHHDHVYKGCH